MNSTKHAALMLKDSVVADGGHGSTSSTKGLLLDDKVIRGAASNAVGISVMTLERRDHQRVVDVVCEISKPLTAFHTEQNREARSVNACEDRLLRMLNGGYTEHLLSFIRMLRDRGVLTACGFLCNVDHSTVNSKNIDLDSLLEHDIVVENEYAHLMGHGVLQMLVARMTRGLWMYGWPFKMCRILSCSAETSDKVMREFIADELNFQELKHIPDMTTALRKLVCRSVFQHVSNRQIATAVADLGVRAFEDARFKLMLQNRTRAIQMTQAVEEINGAQSKQSMAPCRKFRKPATCLAAALQACVVHQRHH